MTMHNAIGSFMHRIVEHKKKDLERQQRHTPLRYWRDMAARRPAKRSFAAALQSGGTSAAINIIAEIKRASPSKGELNPGMDAGRQAERYQDGGAAALSVLTEGNYFKGGIEDLQRARLMTALPVLRKDFILSEYQIYESAAVGADAVLLIAALLPPDRLQACLALCRQLDLDALVEVHRRDELQHAVDAGAQLIGINNRDLETFHTSLQTALDLVDLVPPGRIVVAESGIRTPGDVRCLAQAGIRNFLIGETLVRAADPAALLDSLQRPWTCGAKDAGSERRQPDAQSRGPA